MGKEVDGELDEEDEGEEEVHPVEDLACGGRHGSARAAADRQRERLSAARAWSRHRSRLACGPYAAVRPVQQAAVRSACGAHAGGVLWVHARARLTLIAEGHTALVHNKVSAKADALRKNRGPGLPAAWLALSDLRVAFHPSWERRHAAAIGCIDPTTFNELLSDPFNKLHVYARARLTHLVCLCASVSARATYSSRRLGCRCFGTRRC